MGGSIIADIPGLELINTIQSLLKICSTELTYITISRTIDKHDCRRLLFTRLSRQKSIRRHVSKMRPILLLENNICDQKMHTTVLFKRRIANIERARRRQSNNSCRQVGPHLRRSSAPRKFARGHVRTCACVSTYPKVYDCKRVSNLAAPHTTIASSVTHHLTSFHPSPITFYKTLPPFLPSFFSIPAPLPPLHPPPLSMSPPTTNNNNNNS